MNRLTGADLGSAASRALAARPPKPIDLDGWTAAAVLILLYPKDGVEHVLFTVRSETVEHHKGQVSFPGGAVHEADRDLEATALRETSEEVGIPPETVTVLGRLDDVITISHFRVTPVVGRLKLPPGKFIANPGEVAEILEVPLAHILDPRNVIEEARERGGISDGRPAYEYGGQRIRGVTARILSEFLALLKESGGGSEAGSQG